MLILMKDSHQGLDDAVRVLSPDGVYLVYLQCGILFRKRHKVGCGAWKVHTSGYACVVVDSERLQIRQWMFSSPSVAGQRKRTMYM